MTPMRIVNDDTAMTTYKSRCQGSATNRKVDIGLMI